MRIIMFGKIRIGGFILRNKQRLRQIRLLIRSCQGRLLILDGDVLPTWLIREFPAKIDLCAWTGRSH